MKTFINDDFLLKSDFAKSLYHDFAKKQPIIDYHSHLIPQQIAENKRFDNITQIWLYGDHYKWRAMRANGIDEKYITGNGSDKEKFLAWAKTVPASLRNPLYHWTHLELLRYFGIDELLDESSAERIYDKTSDMLKNGELRVWDIFKKMNVETLCTTDDPVDSLEYHEKILKSGCPAKVLPSWRPDKASAAGDAKAYNAYLDKLSEVSNTEINSFDTLFDALDKRINHFASLGCRLADFGLDYLYAEDFTEKEVNEIFLKVRSGKELTNLELKKLQSAALYRFALQVKKLNWVQQFHAGPIRNNNSRLLKKLGPDTGFDSICDYPQAEQMSRFLNRLDSHDNLAKTILYNINPADNEVFATMIGNFQDGSVPGKMQWGAAWWFLDQKDGIEKQINCLSNHGLLSRFVGMLTDSRSFLSYPRHEYFRRILCNIFAQDVVNGELPEDINLIGNTVSNICYFNAKEYFKF
ncbi:MAG: glucuronate isomerase [Bacteroidales bacterium]|jgi:glucuronate isomerase|nr:glucuronate isomerase [Bacteroidales bacterium]